MKRRQFIESFAAALTMNTAPLLPASSLGKLNEPSQAATNQDENREFFYRPKNAWAGDFIPFYKDKRFHLFFLLDWRDKAKHGEGTPWYQVSTDDFVHFAEHGQMLPRGTKNDQDLYVFTGSVIQALGQYHIFYTGHNPYFAAQGKPEEGVMHAVSDDLLHWRKVPEDTFYASVGRYEPNDWRDAFVFRNEEAGEYWMLLAARLRNGSARRRGCTALCSSKDLKKWRAHDPFWAPGLYYTHECPDLFKLGDWWYLIFSEFSDLVRTRYHMSRSLTGPWTAPREDCFDARAYYAAKTASDGQRRFLFGWNPTRFEQKDFCRWDWGGNLVVHELNQERDGTLSVRIPAQIDDAWTRPVPVEFSSSSGEVNAHDDHVDISAPDSFGYSVAGMMPDRCKIEARIEFEPGTRGCGVLLRTSDDLESSYYVRLEPQNQRMILGSWPWDSDPAHVVESAGDGYMLGLDRWMNLQSDTPVDIKILLDRTIAVIYANHRIALNARLYNLPKGRWGVFVKQGIARFRNLKIMTV